MTRDLNQPVRVAELAAQARGLPEQSGEKNREHSTPRRGLMARPIINLHEFHSYKPTRRDRKTAPIFLIVLLLRTKQAGLRRESTA
jgi:hypothetical protein